jgi:hypothetical protein
VFLLHLQRGVHNKERPFPCTFGECKYAFSEKSNLAKHMRIHLNKRDFACTQCDKKFRAKQTLQVHQLTHLEGAALEAMRKHVCTHEGCAQRFLRKSDLRRHTKIHERKYGKAPPKPDSIVSEAAKAVADARAKAAQQIAISPIIANLNNLKSGINPGLPLLNPPRLDSPSTGAVASVSAAVTAAAAAGGAALMDSEEKISLT